MRAFLRVVIAMLTFGKLAQGAGKRERKVPEGEPSPRAELVVFALLMLSSACAITFIWIYGDDGLNSHTQFLGLSIGGALSFLSAAFIVTAKKLVVSEENEEEYSEPGSEHEHHAEAEEIAQIVRESGSRITRKRLLGGAAGVTAASLGAAFAAPVGSFGPALSTNQLLEAPWYRGRRLVDERKKPFKASDIETETFYTAFPENASHDLLGAPLIVIRLEESQLRLPRARKNWAPQGILAYSKICTHAGCAIALYRTPLFAPTEPKPAFVCPCHYSTFDPADGGTVVFGPAGRNLPQLPLEIDAQGYLRAGGNLSSPPGPSWWGSRLWKTRYGQKPS